MKYYYDDGKSDSYIQLVVSHIDDDGDTILKEDNSEIVIPASEYIVEVYEEMMASGEDIAVCAERVWEVFKNTHRGQDVLFERATDEQIAQHILDDYNANAEDNGREKMTIEDVRSAFA
jgi:hypothetical protein